MFQWASDFGVCALNLPFQISLHTAEDKPALGNLITTVTGKPADTHLATDGDPPGTTHTYL